MQDKEVKKSRKSRTSVIRSTRLPLNVDAILVRRARYNRDGIAGYIRDRLIYDLTRKHNKHAVKHENGN